MSPLPPTHVVILCLLIPCLASHCRRMTLITKIGPRPRGPQLHLDHFDAAIMKNSIEASFLHHILIILPSVVFTFRRDHLYHHSQVINIVPWPSSAFDCTMLVLCLALCFGRRSSQSFYFIFFADSDRPIVLLVYDDVIIGADIRACPVLLRLLTLATESFV
jgi:hypothetical protein